MDKEYYHFVLAWWSVIGVVVLFGGEPDLVDAIKFWLMK